jgi:hypothetical protein
LDDKLEKLLMYSVDDLFSKITGCREKGGLCKPFGTPLSLTEHSSLTTVVEKADTQCPTHFSLSRAYIHVGRNPMEWPRQQNQSTRVNIQWFVRIMCADTWIIECANPFDKPLF